MEDRVARAIWHQIDPDNVNKDWDDQPADVKAMPRDLARTALASMVEPTEGMMELGRFERDTGGSLKDQWTTMVKAALADGLCVEDLKEARYTPGESRWQSMILSEPPISMTQRAGR